MVMERKIQVGKEMIRIVADDKVPFLRGALDQVAKVDFLTGSRITAADVKDADALVTRTRTRCDRELLEGSQLKLIASATIGIDHIDQEFCNAAGIEWINAPGCNSSSVEQYVISSLLYLAISRKLDLSGLTLGVVGVGNVGTKVARSAEAIGMKVILNDPPRSRIEGAREFVELKELQEKADIITLHVPLTKGGEDNTFHLVDRHFLKQVKKGAVLINTSRGAVIDENSLMESIRTGKLSDVVLDVFENEPEINPELLRAITLATPHIAGYSLDGKANGTTVAVRAISNYFKLGMNQWEPDRIPPPDQTELHADTTAPARHEKILWEIFRETYDVTLDDRRLRNDPRSFEDLRGNYPKRREPTAYSVRLFQGYPKLTESLEKLGFSVLADYCA